MKLYLLTRISHVDYDEYAGFVIRASTPEGARKIADRTSNKEMVDIRYNKNGMIKGGRRVWKDPELTTCEELSVEGPAECVLADFRAG